MERGKDYRREKGVTEKDGPARKKREKERRTFFAIAETSCSFSDEFRDDF